MKLHIRRMHPKVVRCLVCDISFEKTHELELHLKTHDNVEEFKCKVCDKIFSLRWRLEKHESAHDLKNVKFCHYFNDEKLCPYEEVGCMFQHRESERCRYNHYCKNKLCQFQHENEVEVKKSD